MVSWLVITSLIGRPRGTCRALISRAPPACWIFHIHWRPTTWTSSASLGGIRIGTWAEAAHQNMNSARNRAPAVQPISNSRLTRAAMGERSALEPRRKRIEKTQIRPNTTSRIRAEKPTSPR